MTAQIPETTVMTAGLGPIVAPGELIRVRLANERTLLSWLRTAVALMGFGLVVARFDLLVEALNAGHDPARVAADAVRSRVIGSALLLTGSCLALVGWLRTRAYWRIIDPQDHAPSLKVLGRTAWMVVLLGLGLAGYLVLL